jgi:IS5 family transposase
MASPLFAKASATIPAFGFSSMGKRRALSESDIDQLRDRVERLKAQVRAKGEHGFRVVKQQFGYTKVRYRGLSKNTAQLRTLFALANP